MILYLYSSNNFFLLIRVVERGLRQSGALDPESLCVVSGIKVWNVTCVMTVLDDNGNLIDACSVIILFFFFFFLTSFLEACCDCFIVAFQTGVLSC